MLAVHVIRGRDHDEVDLAIGEELVEIGIPAARLECIEMRPSLSQAGNPDPNRTFAIGMSMRVMTHLCPFRSH